MVTGTVKGLPSRGSPARDHTAEVEAALDAVTGARGPSVVLAEVLPVVLAEALATAPPLLLQPHVLPRLLLRWQEAGAGSRWPAHDASLGTSWAQGADLVVGLGPRPVARTAASPVAEAWREAGEAAGRCLDRDVVLDVDEVAGAGVSHDEGSGDAGRGVDGERLAALCCGLAVGAAAVRATGGAAAVLHLTGAASALREAAQRGLDDGAAVHLARLLTAAPPNLATPAHVAAWAVRGAAAVGATCEVLDGAALAAGGYGGVLAVGAGSAQQPHLVRLRWRGAGAATDLAVVGKGVTFDSGGLSLKPPGAQQDMRSDKAGAAAALAVVLSLAARRAPVTAEALLPLAENLPGPTATRPGDVVTTRSGRLVQVLDTDFEGRVLMADALTDATRPPDGADGDDAGAWVPPRLLVDVATLTHQAVIALGHEVGALLSPDDAAAELVLAAAERAGEPLWRLPFARRYARQVDLGWGVRNHPLHDSGRAITAALFLDAFVPPGQPWVHLDVAGPAWRGDASGDGATGFGVSTLLEAARALSAG